MFGLLNGRIAYFFQFRDRGPLMLRTVEDKTVSQAQNRFQHLWNGAEQYTTWASRHPSIPEDLIKKVEWDCHAVEEVAKSTSQS
jgi:hypothetical protein